MSKYNKNQRVFVKENTETDKWIPTNGRSGGLWISEITETKCRVFDGQSTFDVPEKDLERGDESKDISYF
jgi:hypothetical protein